MTAPLAQRYADQLAGVWPGYHPIASTRTFPEASYAAGMTNILKAHDIRIFDDPRFIAPLRERIRSRVQELGAAAGFTTEHLAKVQVRKEAIVAPVLQKRGGHPGLAQVISAMGVCESYGPWHDEQTGQTFLRPASGKCPPYYFYFLDPELGLLYVRVRTPCPFRLQVYCNGHTWPARQLTAAGNDFAMADNAFLRIGD